jgi:chaperone modulatory protein CbpM
MSMQTDPLVGQLVEEELTLSIDELSGACQVERARIVELISHGVLEMRGGDAQQLGGDALRRARLALRLQRDLDVNAPGAALVIELLERIEVLEARLRQGS